jgi:ATP/maltotriose-dependent transcriptional regulator MalT
VPVAGRAFRDLRFAFERRDYREVLATGEHAVASLEADAKQRGFAPGAMVLVGGALLSIEHYRDGVAWLERGLAAIRDTPSEHELRGAHWFHRALADTYLLVGEWDRAALYLDWLALPEQPIQSRLTAVRGQLYLASVHGRFDDATFLVNAAAELARRIRSEVADAVVQADRALVLAAQGRLAEAVAHADEVAPRLAAPGRDEQQQWANQQVTVVLTSLARALAEAGDLMTAERYLLEVAVPASGARRTYATAQHQLANAVVWREEGDLERAETPLLDAVDQFDALDTRPALAVARLAEAKLADRRGHAVAATALYDRAATELEALHLHREAADARRRRQAFPGGAPQS